MLPHALEKISFFFFFFKGNLGLGKRHVDFLLTGNNDASFLHARSCLRCEEMTCRFALSAKQTVILVVFLAPLGTDFSPNLDDLT